MNRALQVRSSLLEEQLPVPSTAWLQSFVGQLPPQQPLPQLVARAKAVLLAVDLTASGGMLDPAAAAARNFLASEVVTTAQETRLAHDVLVQLRDMENLEQSRWQQVQELEAIERGEQKRGREIIRIIAPQNEGDDEGLGAEDASGRSMTATTATATSGATTGGGGGTVANATHRLLLQDSAGEVLYGLELTRLPHIGIGRINMGAKLLLRKGTVLARGVVLLEPGSVVFLGGKVDAIHKRWLDGRLERLRAAVMAPPM